MKFYKNLYIGDTVKKPCKIIKKLKRYAKLNHVYLIVYDAESGRVESFHCLMLQQPYYKAKPPYIIGIAGSRDEAEQIICRMVQESLEKTGGVDLRAYLFGENAEDDMTS